jgi:hypothetical protein
MSGAHIPVPDEPRLDLAADLALVEYARDMKGELTARAVSQASIVSIR